MKLYSGRGSQWIERGQRHDTNGCSPGTYSCATTGFYAFMTICDLKGDQQIAASRNQGPNCMVEPTGHECVQTAPLMGQNWKWDDLEDEEELDQNA